MKKKSCAVFLEMKFRSLWYSFFFFFKILFLLVALKHEIFFGGNGMILVGIFASFTFNKGFEILNFVERIICIIRLFVSLIIIVLNLLPINKFIEYPEEV